MYSQYLITHWENVRAGLLATIDKFNVEDLDFKPFPASWTVRQIMLHIAQEENGEFNVGLTQTVREFIPEYPPKQYPSLELIKDLLASIHTPIMHYIEELKDADLDREILTPWGARLRQIEMLDHIIEHEIHHRGELSLILGMLGRTGLDA
jgi:uncharacterized damage-inducible protein DinB